MNNKLQKSAHKVFRLKYHFVFCIKYRKDLFLNEKYIETVGEGVNADVIRNYIKKQGR